MRRERRSIVSISDFILPVLLLIVLFAIKKPTMPLLGIPIESLKLLMIVPVVAVLALVFTVKDKVFIGFSGFKPVFIRLATPIVITGVTGTGKTYFTKYLVKKLRKKFKIIVLDWNNEYYNIVGSTIININNYKFKILDRRDAIEVRDLIAASLTLTDPQTNLLGRILTSLIGSEIYVKDLVEYIASYPVDDSATLTVREALLRKLSPFTGGGDVLGPQNVDEGAVVVDGGEVERRVGYALVLKDLWQKRVKEGWRRGFDTILVIEEAHNLMPHTGIPGLSVFERWILEIRKYGVVTVLVSPSMSLLSDVVSANTAIYVNFIEPRKAAVKLYSKEFKVSVPMFRDKLYID